jgi:hypothetical protein
VDIDEAALVGAADLVVATVCSVVDARLSAPAVSGAS